MTEEMIAFQGKCHRFFKPLWPGEQKELVFGQGLEASPKLMLIGEAPGEQEVLEGKPFVGKAGKNLTAFLTGVNLNRDEIYISNVVKIRPTKISPKGRVVNRPPTKEEIGLFTPFLMEEIALVKPQMLVTLGNVALRVFVGRGGVIGENHGQMQKTVIVPPRGAPVTLNMFPLYHPASVIYNPKLQAVYQQDIQRLKEILEKQGHFPVNSDK